MVEDLEDRRRSCIEWYERSQADIYDLVYARRWWFRLGEVIESNDDLPNEDYFYAVLGDWYAKYLSVGIRRHVDSDRRTLSLTRLLQRLVEEPDLILNLDELRGRYPSFMRDLAEVEHEDSLPSGWAESLIKKLRVAAEPAKAYVNKHVAHLDRVESPATYRDLHAALDVLVEAMLVVKFALTGSAPTTESFCRATEQFDWARALRVPWVTDANWASVANT